jgi:aldose 1-epimerase
MTTMDDTVTLRRGRLQVDLAPACGGAITRFTMGEGPRAVNLFRPAPDPLPATLAPLATSCFPLVPYSGRIAAARLRFGGRTYELPASPTGEANALHGEGWIAPWRVAARSEDRVELAFRGGEGWPFPYAAGQAFALANDRLIGEVWIENTGSQAMPAGLGLHPYFVATPQTQLSFRADRVWLVDDGNLFDRVAPVPPQWDFGAGRRVAGTGLVNGFTGWDGRAVIEWPEWRARLTLTAGPNLRHLVIYTPLGEDFFCVEPVSHSVDAFNLAARGVPDTGTLVLKPGEMLSGRVEFIPEITA